VYLRTLIILVLIFSAEANAQVTISRGASLSVDAARDGRLAIDLLGDIWIVPGGGGDARQLTQNLKSVQRPRWSPEGERLVYSAIADGQQGIWIYEFSDGETRNVSSNGGLDLYPAWHPDGQRVLYSSDTGGGGIDLWEVDLPTGLRWRVSDRPGDETEAAWSADGRDLLYVYRQNDQWSLILRRHSEPEEVLLTSTEKLAAPTWRPDGSLITFFKIGDAGIGTACITQRMAKSGSACSTPGVQVRCNFEQLFNRRSERSSDASDRQCSGLMNQRETLSSTR